MKRKSFIAVLAMCMVFTACANNAEVQTPEVQTTEAQTTGKPVVEEEVKDIISEEFLVSEASRLIGALDYIDCIGGGNIPKDENDTIEQGDRQYARVRAQFENTGDLEEYLTENLTDGFIQNRYSHILGGDQPYYIDIDGALYGYVIAKSCGYPWILEEGKPVISITDVKDDSFTAVTKFDNFGGECEMQLSIVFTDGFWKIASISYDGMTF